jgi:uncharacterized protein YlxP (DUF503 family)
MNISRTKTVDESKKVKEVQSNPKPGNKSNGSDNENSSSDLQLIFRSQNRQLVIMCEIVLRMFLGVCDKSVQERISQLLQKKFRLSTSASNIQDLTNFISKSIAPVLVETMDQVHLREIIQTIMVNDSSSVPHGGRGSRKDMVRQK